MNLREFDRDQLLMLPPSVDDWIPQDHLARTVVAVVERLDLSQFYARLRADGRGGASYDPRILVGLLLYGYSVGERSARRLERMCWQDVAVRFVVSNAQPDHATIARFRAEHEDALEGLFTQMLSICGRAGLGRVGTVAVDGTKLQANASKNRAVDEEQLRKIAREILQDAARVDAEEDELYGAGSDVEVPEQLRTAAGRKAAIDKAFEELEAVKHSRDARHELRAQQRQRLTLEGRPVSPWFLKNDNKRKSVKVNLTDPESRQVRNMNTGFCGYNAQAVVSEDQIVVSADIVQDPDDFDQLHPMLLQAREQLDAAGIKEPIVRAMADAGYVSEHAIAMTPPGSPELILANAEKLQRSRFELARRLGEWCDTAPRQVLRARRKAIIEPVFGQIKHNRGIRSLSRRGWAAAKSEWSLICTTHNLLKLHTALNQDPQPA